MRLDFSQLPLKEIAFSELPMGFLESTASNFLGAVMDLVAIETGNRVAREQWQQMQLQNLLMHAAQKSPIWKNRFGARKIKGVRLGDLPIQTRADVKRQVETEGSLVKPGPNLGVYEHSTSGSTGIPVRFFVTAQNGRFNTARLAAQPFMEDWDLSLNRTRIIQQRNDGESGFTVRKSETWLEPLQSFIRTGTNKQISYFQPDMGALCRELERDPIGYLIIQPRFIDIVLQRFEPEFFKRAGTAMIIPVAEGMDPAFGETFASLNIPVRGNYSSEEVGLIASECDRAPGFFHIATSNVLVEVVAEKSARFEEKDMGRVLVTQLHSYATPFIRYDIGDVARLDSNCPCGHDGPVLANIYGRAKSLVRHRDGRVSIFLLRGKELAACAKFDEYRIRQTDLETMVVEIGGRDALDPGETSALTAIVKAHAGEEFAVQIRPIREIDWGSGTKRLGYISEVL